MGRCTFSHRPPQHVDDFKRRREACEKGSCWRNLPKCKGLFTLHYLSCQLPFIIKSVVKGGTRQYGPLKNKARLKNASARPRPPGWTEHGLCSLCLPAIITRPRKKGPKAHLCMTHSFLSRLPFFFFSWLVGQPGPAQSGPGLFDEKFACARG